MLVCACVCACMRAYVRVYVHMRARACVLARVQMINIAMHEEA